MTPALAATITSAGPTTEKEFAFLDDEADDDAARARAMPARMRGVARQAALDPDDGIAL
jgi:type IV secretion system protein VirD4